MKLRDLIVRNKTPAILILIALVVQLGFSILSPIIQYYIEALENPLTPPPEYREKVLFTADVIWYIAFNTAAFMFLRAPFSTFFGRLSDKIGRKRLIIAGLVIYVLIGLSLGLASSAWQIIVIRGVQGICSAMVWPVAEALLMENAPIEARTRMMTLYVMSLNIANLVGPGLGGLLYNMFFNIIGGEYAIDILRPTVLSIVPLFIIAMVLGFFIREGERRIDEIQVGGDNFRESDIYRSIYIIYITGLSNGFGVGLIASIVVVYVTEFIVKEPFIIGSIMMFAGITGLILAYPIANIADKKIGKKNTALFAMLLRTIAFLYLPFVRDIGSLYIVMTLQNISFNTGLPSIRAIQADLTSSKIRGRVFGQQQTFFNTGMGIGAIVGALIYINYAHTQILNLPGVAVLFFTSAAISLVNAFLIKKYIIVY